MSNSLLKRILVPVASDEDARSTIQALRPHLDSTTEHVIAVHVIEKAGGAPDKASVEQREREAVDMFEAVSDGLAGRDVSLETDVAFGTDVAETIIETAHASNATAIAFTPRGGSRWVKLLAGDVTSDLVAESDLPIIVLPDVEEDNPDR